MKKQGQVQRWVATRGFGFIRSPDTVADVFFHIKDYRGDGNPREGQKVWFDEITVGGKGPRAVAVHTQQATTRPARPMPARAAPPTSNRPVVFLLLVLAWAAALAWAIWTHRLPWWSAGAAVVLNLVTFFTYWIDKHAAQTGQWRTKEDSLHLLGLLGGWPGAGVAQSILRHKSHKAAFQATYWTTVVAHCAALLGWLFWLQPKALLNL
jgi:uncharacterized membrane protein YsdA (DUF1294 family)/cold shock CspA family protein